MYTTIEEVYKSLKSDVLDLIIGNESIEDDEIKQEKIKELIIEAIGDSDAEIDGYLCKRYSVPLIIVPKVINKFSKDISLYNLFSRQGIEKGTREENYLIRYNAAIKFLEAVAKGTIDLGGTSSNEEDSSSSKIKLNFKINSSEKIFNRNSLKGM